MSFWLAVALLAPLATTTESLPENFLFVVADDLGTDRLSLYTSTGTLPQTPTIDSLAAEGVTFTRAWASPVCSPGRAGALCGRYSFRTGIGATVKGNMINEPGLQPDATTGTPPFTLGLPMSYRTAALGKWHLGRNDAKDNHTVDCGFEYFSGSWSNLNGGTYYDWTKTTKKAGFPYADTPMLRYATSDTVDAATGQITGFHDDPWMIWVAFNAPHRPFHGPPISLHSTTLPWVADPDDPNDPNFAPVPYYNAMVEALDTELARLLAAMTPAVRERTNIIFVSDNGTMEYVIEPPFPNDHGKGTMYEVGLNVPLIVSGPMVAQTARGETCDALVGMVDFFDTVMERTGGTASTLDSYSLAPYLADPQATPSRPFIYSEKFKPNLTAYTPPANQSSWQRAIREDRYKLIVRPGVQPGILDEELYDLDLDPHELNNLLNDPLISAQASTAYAWLKVTMDRLLDS